MTSPRSIRFETATDVNLAAFAARHAGLSHSGAAALLVEEGLRMDAHPGILFREGPAGRRAVLVGGPDVWEVVRAVRSARDSDSGLSGEQVLDAVIANTGLERRLLDIAVDYYAAFPVEVDALIAHATSTEDALEAALAVRTSLLGA